MYAKTVGGAELQFLELANYLSKGQNVRLLCLGGVRALKNVAVNESIDIKVYAYSGLLSVLLGLSKAVFDNIRYPASSIVTTSFLGNVLGFTIGLFRKAKLISLQTVSVCMRHPVIDRFVLHRFGALIAGANDIKDYLIEYGQKEDRIHVVHNWVDFSKRVVSKQAEEMKQELGVEGKKTIGCIGRFHPQKGQIYLIRAFAIIITEFPDVVLILVGDGETRGLLEKEVEALGLTKNVVFTGAISGDEYNNLLNMFDIYVQPSLFEGLPRTLLDAMYMGKPIVATAINGNKEAIKHERSGLLVPSEQGKPIAEALARIIQDESFALNLAKKAKLTAESDFNMTVQLREIELLIQK